MARTKRNSDKITSIAAIIVAIAAIAVSFWQGMENRKHNRLSVKPKLQIIFKADPEGDAEIIVRNDGLGPANIRRFDVMLDGELLDEVSLTAIFELTKRMGLDSIPFNFDPIVQTTTVRAGDQAKILSFPKSDSLNSIKVADAMLRFINRIDLKIEYESMYGEVFGTSF